MKKLILLCALFLSMNLFGCGEDVMQDDFKDEAEKENIVGVISEQGPSGEYKGTHLLTLDNGSITPLRSISVNLSSDRYIDNKVELTGFMNPSDDVFEVSEIVLIDEIEEEDEEEEAELETFKSSFLGFKVDYYSNWMVKELENQAIFTAKSGNEIIVTQIPFAYSPPSTDEPSDTILSPLETYLKEYYPEIDEYDDLFHVIGDSDLDAVKLDDGNDKLDHILYRNGLIYKLTFYPVDSESVDDEQRDYMDMVNSFNFIGFSDEEVGEVEEAEATESASLPSTDLDFTYFESLPYHFRGKYPSSWYYAGTRNGDGGVIHHYSFSDEAIENGNELISLDLISGDLPAGQSENLNGNQIVKTYQGTDIVIGVEVEGQKYLFKADKQYEDIVIHMAASIERVEVSESEEE